MPAEQLQLPMFEKRRPQAARLKLNGLSADAFSSHGLDSTIYIVVEARITEVAHVLDPKVGMVRLHKAQIVRHCPHDEEIAEKLLDEYNDELARQRKKDEDPLDALSDEPGE